jgi:hypothetical protein
MVAKSHDNRTTGAAAPKGERGQAVVEFAMLAPLMILFMLVIVDIGIGLNHRVVVTNAAREGARHGATGASIDQIKARTLEHSEGLVTDPANVEVWFFDVNGDGDLLPGDAVAVGILYSYQLLTSLPDIVAAFGGSMSTSFEMNACTDMRLEQVWVGATITPGTSPCEGMPIPVPTVTPP